MLSLGVRGVIASSNVDTELLFPDLNALCYWPLQGTLIDQNSLGNTLIPPERTTTTATIVGPSSVHIVKQYVPAKKTVPITDEFSIQLNFTNGHESNSSGSRSVFRMMDGLDGISVSVRESYYYAIIRVYHDGGVLAQKYGVGVKFYDAKNEKMSLRCKPGTVELWWNGVLDRVFPVPYTSIGSGHSQFVLGTNPGYYKQVKIYDKYITDADIADYQLI